MENPEIMSMPTDGAMPSPPKTAPRARYTYKFPQGIKKQTGIESVTIIELTAQEELMATKRANNDPIRLAFEMALQCLVAVNGREVSLVDGSADKIWETMHPQARQLVMRAYDQTHNIQKDDAKDFLESRTVEVG